MLEGKLQERRKHRQLLGKTQQLLAVLHVSAETTNTAQMVGTNGLDLRERNIENFPRLQMAMRFGKLLQQKLVGSTVAAERRRQFLTNRR